MRCLLPFLLGLRMVMPVGARLKCSILCPAPAMDILCGYLTATTETDPTALPSSRPDQPWYLSCPQASPAMPSRSSHRAVTHASQKPCRRGGREGTFPLQMSGWSCAGPGSFLLVVVRKCPLTFKIQLALFSVQPTSSSGTAC